MFLSPRRSRRRPRTVPFLGPAVFQAQPQLDYQWARCFTIQSAASSKAPQSPRQLTHIDPTTGDACMVDVSDKGTTKRFAVAVGKVWIPQHVHELLSGNAQAMTEAERKALNKGDVFTVAQVAGVQAAKRTSDLIPLCHPLQLSHINVDVRLCDLHQRSTISLSPASSSDTNGATTTATTVVVGDKPSINIRAKVTCVGRTGVEMEALMAVNVAALTVWDMLKAMCGQEMEIGGITVVEKRGGKLDWHRDFEGHDCE